MFVCVSSCRADAVDRLLIFTDTCQVTVNQCKSTNIGMQEILANQAFFMGTSHLDLFMARVENGVESE